MSRFSGNLSRGGASRGTGGGTVSFRLGVADEDDESRFSHAIGYLLEHRGWRQLCGESDAKIIRQSLWLLERADGYELQGIL